ncbi:16S rRNA processing protein RimM [Parasphingorhabdus marina DSM 22363]|uniref:Ribosome maturation factor RimM n=1 Tax=Parasphingorhabdus marina DSM 22363 TaxID=1123272 RepID=A0A1N6FJJ6_9SPHN|nr:ribosome maturation factor RimM [Parasphingorhabdus marina]SIN95390.1 16S rRNA processing protein RimM [Parasphingorhabdus marina DSM 22363]
MAEVDPDTSVPLAVITGAHGVTGEVRIKLFCDSLDSLKQHKAYNGGALTLKKVKPHKMGAIARFSEITDRNAAEAARGTELSVPRSALPALDDDEFYHIDIIGLRCVSDNGEELGKVFAIYEFGAGDVIEIERASGKKFMIPIGAIDMRSDPAIVKAEFVE